VADHALALLPADERAWMEPHKTLYLLGTEAPDNDNIPAECGAPNTGYDDRRLGHSVEWNSDYSEMIKDRAAKRALEEYLKAVDAFRNHDTAAAAYYLGAMAHNVGAVSQYGHSVPFEHHHSDYEGWVGRRTDSFEAGTFESYIVPDGFVRRSSYTAVKLISKKTAGGSGQILWATRMDQLYPEKNDSQSYKDSIGASLNYGVNVLADVLHTFYLNEVR